MAKHTFCTSTYVSKMASASVAQNLNSASIGIGHLFDGPRHALIEGRPAAAGVEFGLRVVERRIAADAGEGAFFGVLGAHFLLKRVLQFTFSFRKS